MLSVTDEAGVRVVTLDRPDRRNALTLDSLDAIEDAVCGADQSVVYLHGAGSAFCAGADLDSVRELDGDTAPAFSGRGQDVMNAIEDADTVVVAGVDGAARGGGVELALACDVRVATPDATFAEPGVSLGIFGSWGGTRRLGRAVGETHALDLSLSGRTIDAETALDIGLVSRVVDDPRRVADEIARNDPDALRHLKHLLRTDYDRDDGDAREREVFGELLEDGL